MVLQTFEGLGFCKKGEGGPFVDDGRMRLDGALPTNTDGGGLSHCHPGMRGMFLLVEAVRQLRGEARRPSGREREAVLRERHRRLVLVGEHRHSRSGVTSRTLGARLLLVAAELVEDRDEHDHAEDAEQRAGEAVELQAAERREHDRGTTRPRRSRARRPA